jgi:hypothetical protein
MAFWLFKYTSKSGVPAEEVVELSDFSVSKFIDVSISYTTPNCPWVGCIRGLTNTSDTGRGNLNSAESSVIF